MDLQLPPEFEAQLRQHAAAAGMNVEQFAIAAIKKELAVGEELPPTIMLPRAVWKSRFDALVESFPTRMSAGRIDCSRESIYGDRGR